MAKVNTVCSLNIVLFLEVFQFFFFSNSASSVAELVFDLSFCTHTDTEGETERGQSPEYILNLRENTILNKHPAAMAFGPMSGLDINFSIFLN